MPKQIYKIDNFDGGINNDSDPRDIADNQCEDLTDVNISKVGKVIMQGGASAYNSLAKTTTIKPGYGLFAFSHDYTMPTSTAEYLTNGAFTGGTSWTATNDIVYNTNNYIYTYTSSTYSNLTQLDSDMALSLISGERYKFQYTISSNTLNDPLNRFHLAISSSVVDSISSYTIPHSEGLHTVYFTAGADGADFTITTAVMGTISGGFNLDDFSLVLAPAESATDYICLQNNDGTAIYDGSAWVDNAVDLGDTADVIPVYTIFNGILRIADANFGADNRCKWYGRIKRTHFDGILPGGVSNNYEAWYSKDAKLSEPSVGVIGHLSSIATGTDTNTLTDTTHNPFADMEDAINDAASNSNNYIALNTTDDEMGDINSWTSQSEVETDTMANTWNGKIYYIFPAAGCGFNLHISTSGSNGTIDAGTYEFAQSFIYDGNQESQLFIYEQTIALAANEIFTTSVYATAPFGPRISGGRVYIREQNSTNPWTLLLDISLKDGVRNKFGIDYQAWVLHPSYGGTNYYCMNQYHQTMELNIDTYDSINGFLPDEVSITIGDLGQGYKTAVIANRHMWIGNVRRTNQDGETVVESDRMYRSEKDKFDTFIASGYVDVAINDGDAIIKIDEFADRILQFKKRKLYIINISQQYAFLEGSFNNLGINYPSQTTRTSMGVVWVNSTGCFFYDGETIHRLTNNKISQEAWSAFLGTIPSVIYDETNKNLIVLADCESSDGDIYIYNFKTASWVKGDSKFNDSVNRTNFINTADGEVVLAENTTGTFYKWDNTASSSGTYSLITKEITFGTLGYRKDIYKVLITHKGAGDNKTELWYSTDNGTYVSAGNFNNNTNFTSQSFTVSVKNIYSMQLKIIPVSSVTIPATLEINDIQIVYRVKGVL